MDTGNIISIIALGITILGFAVTCGRLYQKLNDLSKKVGHVDRTVAQTIATTVTDGNRITSLEARYDQILSSLVEIKTDIRLFINQK